MTADRQRSTCRGGPPGPLLREQSHRIAALAVVMILLSQLSIGSQGFRAGAATQGPDKTPGQRPAGREVVKLNRSPKALVMAKAFSEGKLPEPARLPRGNVDQQAEILAKAVSLRDESSTAALYAAVLAAGFAVRDTDGSVTQTQERGQGLVLDASEIAATAKLYGEDYGVMLAHFSDSFTKTVPDLNSVPLANILLDGIRAGASSTNPSVRFLSRFIVELGKNSESSTDLLGSVDPAKTRLDAIQVTLIMSRLAGDLMAAQQKNARLEPRSNYAHRNSGGAVLRTINWQSPCPTSDRQDVILDYTSLASTTLFGILADRIGGKLERFGGLAGFANLISTVFKFILTYSMVDVEITMDDEMLVRTKSSSTPGETRTLTAKLKILPTSWEKLNCLRWAFSALGIDPEMPKSGPLADTTVAWSIVLGGDSRGALGTFVDLVSGADDRDDLIYLKPKPGAHPMPNKQTADENGESVIDVVGAPQKQDLTRRKVLEVYKAAGVTVGVQIKPTKIKDAEAALSTLGDILGVVISFLTKDPVGGGVGLVFETMYRANWYSAKPFYFMVKDWEPCKGLWQGTITFSTSVKEKGSAESNVNRSSWNDVALYDSTVQLSGRRTAEGAPIALVKATASQVRERISSGKGVCYRTSTIIHQLQGSSNATTTGFSITSNPRSGEYHVSAPTIIVEASGSESIDSEVKGSCNNPYNKDLHERKVIKAAQLSPEGFLEGIGKIDPANPDVISGTNSITMPTNKGGERKVTITWNLRRCQD